MTDGMIRYLLEIVLAGIAVIGFFRATVAGREKKRLDGELRQIREEINRPDIVFDGVRSPNQNWDPSDSSVHIEARTCVKNVGKTKATILHLNHRVYVGNALIPVRSKHPENLFMAPGGVFGFKWDLDLSKGAPLTDPDWVISITVEIDYMGIGTRSYRYEGRYEFSVEDDLFIAMSESDIPT